MTDNITYLFNMTGTFAQRECEGKVFETVECINKYFCPQITPSVIRNGIFLLIGIIVGIVATNYVLKKLKDDLEIQITPTKSIMLRFSDDKYILQIRLFIYELVNDILILYLLLIIYLNI